MGCLPDSHSNHQVHLKLPISYFVWLGVSQSFMAVRLPVATHLEQSFVTMPGKYR